MGSRRGSGSRPSIDHRPGSARYLSSSPRAASDLRHELIQKGVVDLPHEALAVLARVELAQPHGHSHQARRVEGQEPQLRLAQAGEATLLEEADPVVERR
jgi:hypothetical protein